MSTDGSAKPYFVRITGVFFLEVRPHQAENSFSILKTECIYRRKIVAFEEAH